MKRCRAVGHLRGSPDESCCRSIARNRWKICAFRQETACEALRGNRKGQYSIRINDQWRICFVWARAMPVMLRLWTTIEV